MNRNPVLFRVDGTFTSGMERLTRCLTFAAALQRRRRPTYFVSQLESSAMALQIKRAGNEWLDPDGPVGAADDLVETLQEIRRLEPSAVVLDGASFDESYMEAVRRTGTLVVAMDHLANTCTPSGLVINPLLGPSKDSFSFRPGCQLLLGKRFALIRSELRRVRQTRSQEPPQPFRVLLALGDDDPNNQTLPLAKQLLAMSRLDRIDIGVRPEHPQLESIQALAEKHAERVTVLTETKVIASRLPRCHFALTAGSGWALELACVGIPQLVIVQSEAYWPTAQRLEDEGAATCLGWHESVSASTIRQAIQNLLGDPFERQAMMRCGRKLIDGRGPDRLVTALEVMLHPARRLAYMEAA